MKFLIWLGCAFVYSFIVTVLSASGIMLGGIPTMCLLGCTFWAARRLCKEYDSHKESKQVPINSEAIIEFQQKPQPLETIPALNPEPVISSADDPTTDKSSYLTSKPKAIAVISITACLLIICVTLGILYYHDTLELKQTIADCQQQIQQLEADLLDANDNIERQIKQSEVERKYAKESMVNFYNDGFTKGFNQGYNVASTQKGKAKSVNDLWPEIAEQYLLPYE